MNLFGFEKPVIGMIHTAALPGTPRYGGTVKPILDKAIAEAQLYHSLGVEVLMIENMHDVPYLNRQVGPEVVSAMSILLHEIKSRIAAPLGIQILAGANKHALAAAHAAGADFIRAEGYIFSHVGDEGTFQSDAGELLRYRAMIGAGSVKVFTDIKKKHSAHALTADVSIAETAKAAEFFLSDGVIVTGSRTGAEPSIDELQQVKQSVAIPVLAGSGITAENIGEYRTSCDAFIIGSYFKKDGMWQNEIDPHRVSKLLKAKHG